MDVLPAKILGSLLFALCASTPFVACEAAAQGFSSVSSMTTPPPATAAAPVTPAADAAATTARDVGEPAAQLAALGTGVVSGTDKTSGAAGAGPSTSFEAADRVIVDKSDRRLYLLKHGKVVAEYPIKLGLNPYGHKQQEGDFRTPEGRYTLSRRNARSDFFLAIQVSYPNKEDAAWAKENGWQPGGLIMIHGQPNVPKRPADFYANRDWTDGCIALSNADMVDVWLRTTVGTPIEIRP
jgi:lipoprotein-anchoring transpeptidase ErfK/SrfK